jgi:hypothetical protein
MAALSYAETARPKKRRGERNSLASSKALPAVKHAAPLSRVESVCSHTGFSDMPNSFICSARASPRGRILILFIFLKRLVQLAAVFVFRSGTQHKKKDYDNGNAQDADYSIADCFWIFCKP